MFGDGSSARDYTYVADTVNGILGAMIYDSPYDVFNLGNSRPISLLEMIHTIEAAIGKPARIEHLPDQPGDVPITYAEIGKGERTARLQSLHPVRRGNWAFRRMDPEFSSTL
jgi:UDP-glucuronate 4-epimerase